MVNHEAVGAPVFCGLAPGISWARAWRMSRWIVNVTPRYSSRDAVRVLTLDEIVVTEVNA